MNPHGLWLAAAVLGYTLVLDDGSRLALKQRPEQRGPVVIAALPDGTVVSLPAARIDWEASERTSAEGPRAAPERSAKAARPKRRQVITNRTIDAFSAQLPPEEVPLAETDARGTVTVLAEPEHAVTRVEPGPPGDDLGRSPEHWRERARAARDEARRAEFDREAAARALAAEHEAALHGRRVTSADGTLSVVHYSSSDEERAVRDLRLSELDERLRYATAALADAERREADLRREARTAGADPGWLRLPVAP